MDEHAMTLYADRLLGGGGRTPQGGWDPALVVPSEHIAWLKDGYDAAVATSDRWLERVLARLDELGLTENTVIAFTSDHGEEFLDHGHLKHGQSLHTELVRVPLVMAGPRIPNGRRVGELVSNVDLAAAIARAAGVRFGPAGALDLLAPDALAPRAVLTTTESGWWNGDTEAALRGLRNGNWSLHYRRIDGDPDPLRALDAGRVLLFDVLQDPGELRDVATAERARVAALVAEIERREQILSARRPKAVRAGSGTLRLLQATGYAGQGR
jgi:arylsulfatase A-like enzyme